MTSSQRYLLLTLLCLSSPARELPADSFPLEERNVLYTGGLRSSSTSLSHVEGKGVGCDTGYSTVSLFASRPQCHAPWIPFIDLQGHIFNNGLYATNAGVGLRYARSALVWGGSCYYDYRHTDSTNYHQLGLSLELIGAYWGLYVNGYFPLGVARSSPFDRSLQSRGCPSGSSYFQGHHLFLQLAKPTLFHSKQEVALTGIDATLLMRAYEKDVFSLDCGAGPYYYVSAAKTPAAVGGRATIHLGFTEYVTCAISTTYDTLFHQRAQIELRFSMPLGKRSCAASKRPPFYAKRLMQGAYRNDIIALHTHTLAEALYTEAALSPTTGAPYQFYFVNNQSHSKGTFESPFSHLEQALLTAGSGDIIYVYPGDGSPYEINLTLLDHQRLLGSGHDHSLPTHRGTVLIPAQTQTMPSLRSRSPDPLLRLASHTTVSGFHLENKHPQVLIQAVDCEEVAFTRNACHFSSTAAALSLDNCSGILSIRENQFCMSEAKAFAALSHAVLLSSKDKGSIHLTCDRNTFQNTDTGLVIHSTGESILCGSFSENCCCSGIALAGHSTQQSTCSLNILRNEISAESGMTWTGSDRTAISLSIQDNHLHGVIRSRSEEKTSGFALELSDNARAHTLEFTHNTFTSPLQAHQSDGMRLNLSNEAQVDRLVCSENDFSFPAYPERTLAQGIEIVAKDKSFVKEVLIENNHIKFAPPLSTSSPYRSHGIEIGTSETAQIGKEPRSLCIQHNTITGILSRGILTLTESSQPFAATISHNTLCINPYGKEAVGILAVSRGGTSQLHIEHNQIDGNRSGWFGIYVSNQGHSPQQVSLEYNAVIGVQSAATELGGGIGIATEGYADLHALVNNNSLSNNLPQGLLGLGPTIPDTDGKLNLALYNTRGYESLQPDGYVLWDPFSGSHSRILYQENQNNQGTLQWGCPLPCLTNERPAN